VIVSRRYKLFEYLFVEDSIASEHTAMVTAMILVSLEGVELR
jgi:hypothetical protein